MKNYSIEFEVPSYHVQDARFWKTDPKYYVEIVHYAIPPNSKQKVFDHYVNGEHKEMNYDEIYKFEPGAYLKLQKILHGQPHEKGDKIHLGSSSLNYMMEFNDDCTKFALATISKGEHHINNNI